ncbi:MAG: hypothetical protein BIFFINMI_02404 [Phycisphaerae bacterium]|nr:hypothetical protein [Phycisphaerae bacterium]
MTHAIQNASPLLREAASLLERNHPEQALARLSKARGAEPAVENARGVCLMRLGRVDEALELYRRLLYPRGGLQIAPGASPKVLANFATALMLTGNLSGCVETLDAADAADPAVVRVRQAVATWRKSLGVVRRLLAKLGLAPGRPTRLEFPPGAI